MYAGHFFFYNNQDFFHTFYNLKYNHIMQITVYDYTRVGTTRLAYVSHIVNLAVKNLIFFVKILLEPDRFLLQTC